MPCSGFSLGLLLLLQSPDCKHVDSVVTARRLNSCCLWVSCYGMWNFPRLEMGTHVTHIDKQVLNHWTKREVLKRHLDKYFNNNFNKFSYHICTINLLMYCFHTYDLFLKDHKCFSQYPHTESQFIALLGKLSPLLRMHL